MHKPLAIAGFAIGLAALALQLVLTIPASIEAGRGLFSSFVFYFSFFTILTNILVVLVHAGQLWPHRALDLFRRKPVQGLVAAAIAFVMIFYHLLLLGLWQPESWWLVCDILLHYVTSTLYIAFWLTFLADGTLRLRMVLPWLLYPAVYAVYALVRGLATGDYPYALLDIGENGWQAVLISLIYLFSAFIVLSLVVIGLDTLKARLSRAPQN